MVAVYCENDCCGHLDCKQQRVVAAHYCRVCGRPLGKAVDVVVEQSGKTASHARCALTEVFERR